MKKYLLALLTISLLFSTSCRKAATTKTENKLNISMSGEIPTIDPALSYDTVSATVIYQCYETLYEYHYLKRPYEIIPLLADGQPVVSNNGKTYTIKIKKGVYYHNDPVFNGQKREVIAEDFITQIKRLAFLPTKSNGWWLFDGKIKGLNEFRKKAGNDLNKIRDFKVEGLKAIDSHTLQIELLEPFPQMIYALTMTFTTPIPFEAVSKYSNDLNKNLVGTGPFLLKEWQSNYGAKLVKNPEYREIFYPTEGDKSSKDEELLRDAGKKLPFLDAIEFKIIKEDQTRWLNFRSKKIDMLVIPKDNFSSAVDESGHLRQELVKDGIQLQISPTLTYWWLSFNMKHPLLGKNKLLRDAFAHAVDVDKYIQMFTNNVAQKANSIYPPGVPGYDPSHRTPYSYNLNKAKDLLAKAGFPNGKGLPEFNYDVRGTDSTSRQSAEFLKQELDKVGIKIKVILNPFPTYLKKQNTGELQVFQDGWAMDYPDAENSLQLLISKNFPPGPNATNYSHPKVDALFAKLKILPNGPEKDKILHEIEQIVEADLPWAMWYYSRNYIVFHSYMKNYRQSDVINNSYKYYKVLVGN